MSSSCVLKVDNCYSTLITDDETIKRQLSLALRFRDRNYYHNPRYRMRLWDGYVSFFNEKTGRFLTGLIPEVKLALVKLNHTYTVEDARKPISFGIDAINKEWLNHGRPSGVPAMELRDYQIEYINLAILHRRGLIYAPTSSGKSASLIGIIKALPAGTRTLVLTNSASLLEQIYDDLKLWRVADKIGRYYAKVKDLQTITVATVQSCKNIMDWIEGVEAVLVDEIHDLMSVQAVKVYSKLKNANVRIGMSATPFKFGEKDKVHKFKVKGYIGPAFMVKSTETGKLTTQSLQERKILSSAECFFHTIEKPFLPFAIFNDAVTYGIAQNEFLNDIVMDIVASLTGRTLILVERISQGDRLHELLPDAAWVRGTDTTKTRKAVLDSLRESKEKTVALATRHIFNTGINVFIHNLINCAGGSAEHMIIQRFGRGLRRTKDKQHLTYHDFLFKNNDYLEKHSRKRIEILSNEGHTIFIDGKLYEVKKAA